MSKIIAVRGYFATKELAEAYLREDGYERDRLADSTGNTWILLGIVARVLRSRSGKYRINYY